jgi:SAM-dependent methyltransferase
MVDRAERQEHPLGAATGAPSEAGLHRARVRTCHNPTMPPDLAGAQVGSGDSPSLQFTRVEDCPTCGAADSRAWLSAHDLLHGIPGTFDYRKCQRCRTVYQAPRVSDESLAGCYPDDYFTHETQRDGSPCEAESGWRSVVRALVLGSLSRSTGRSPWAAALGRVISSVPFIRARAAFGMMTELVPAGHAERCLEIGPGTGADLSRLRGLGWAVVEGLDVDAEAAGRAASRSGCTVHVGHLSRFERPEKFDLIYASHSFEHLPSVRSSILAMRELLAESGRLVLILPNAESITTRLDRHHTVTIDAPRHLVLPPLRALRSALGEAGFAVELARTSARRTAHHRAVARGRRRGIRGMDAWQEPRIISDRIVQWIAHLLCTMRLHVGEELVVVARKAG